MSIRRQARELVLQSLYQSELSGKPLADAFVLLCENFEINKKALPYARQLLDGFVAEQEDLDRRISDQADNWRMERMSLIDRNIIRIAAYELCCRPDIPTRVVINEALEVARRFSTDEAVSFINGILDAISRTFDRPSESEAG